MKPHIYVPLAVVLFTGCVATGQRTMGPVPISAGSARDFVALVPSSPATPRCEDVAGPPGPRGGRNVALVYGSPAERQVTVTLDAGGTPTRYMDVRGDLSMSADNVGDRTTIGLYLTEGYAVASNRPASGAPVMFEIPLDEALSSAELGDPAGKLEEVLTTCVEAREALEAR
jgi:hypothetical protein